MRGASGSADWIHLVLKESEARSIFDTQGNLAETRSINTLYSRELSGDTIDQYSILKVLSESRRGYQYGILNKDAINFRYSTILLDRGQTP